jgi:signal transduction histidine kinase
MSVLFRHWLESRVPKRRRAFGNTNGGVARRVDSIRARRLGIAVLATCVLFHAAAGPEVKEIRRVTVFYELGLASPAVALADREMRAALEDSHFQTERYPEYLETTLFDHSADQQQFRESYIRKYQKRRPDLVIALGPSEWVWIVALVIMLCLSVLALYVQLKRAKDRQMGLSGMLITAQERERSRLASEIHDDFSQRLALMALELETAEEAIGTSPDEAVQRVHNILNFASELGADLHTLSHRLHSSTLERLGLVPGITSLCKEFAVQQGIEVEFLTDDVPRSVHPDVALCLFRIVQEGLRNLKKHSGAARAQVRLRRVGDKLLVSVVDEGIGFNVRDLGEKEGLGVRSMEERAFLLGGRFEIHSKPGKGTRIEASVPLEPKSERRQMRLN